MQQRETTNLPELADPRLPHDGRVVAIDPGTKRCGIAVSDESRLVTRPLPFLKRTSWKKLLSMIKEIVAEFDAAAVVVGLPLESDGSEGVMSIEAREIARKLTLSLAIPVFLQDERMTTYEARGRLWQRKHSPADLRGAADSEAAAIILADFLDRTKQAG